jgi:lipopolysaccharide export system protein LptA
MRRLKSLSLFVLWMTLTPIGFARSSDEQQPYHFTSDSMVYNKNKRQTIYLGHVQVTQGTTHLSGDKIIVQYDQNTQIQTLITTGNLAHYSTLPDHESDRLYAEAKKIIFNPITKKALLRHQAKITQKNNIFAGPRIWYDMAHGVVHTTPRQHQKTVIIIQPQDQQT